MPCKKTVLSQKALIALCIAVLLPVVSYFLVKEASREAIVMPRHFYADYINDTVVNGKQQSDTTWHQVANISLVNQLGDTVRLNELRGKIVVADFFFTSCPSICPHLTLNMKALQDALKTKDDTRKIDTPFIHFLSFSVDPEHDSVAALKKYADRFGVNHDMWWLLTGPKKTIYDFALNEVKLPLVDNQQVDSNFIHTSKFVVIDKNGIVRGYYNGLDTTELSKLSEDVTFLMLEKDKNQPSPLFAQLKAIWPIYIAVIVGVIIFVLVTRKSRTEPKL